MFNPWKFSPEELNQSPCPTPITVTWRAFYKWPLTSFGTERQIEKKDFIHAYRMRMDVFEKEKNEERTVCAFI